MDATLQSPSIESFSYSWLANLNATSFDPDLYLASNDASYYHDESPFIEMDPRLPPSKRFIRVSSDFGFDFPVSESPLSLVHADEVISNGILVPILVKDSKKDRLGTEDGHVTTTSGPLSAQNTMHSSSRVVCVSSRRCRRLSKRWFHKYLKFLFRPFFCISIRDPIIGHMLHLSFIFFPNESGLLNSVDADQNNGTSFCLSRSKHEPNGKHNERKKQKIARKSSEGLMDDDESLNSIFIKRKKKKTVCQESEEEGLMADTTKKNADGNEIQFRDIQVSERDEVDATNINTANMNYSSDSESEKMRLGSLNASEIKTFENPDTSQDPLFDDGLVDELVDFDENTDSIGMPKYNVVRRRARMVIDSEDDD